MIIQMGSTLTYSEDVTDDCLGDVNGTWLINNDGTVFFEGELEYDGQPPMDLTELVVDLKTLQQHDVRGNFIVADSIEEGVFCIQLTNDGIAMLEGNITYEGVSQKL